MAVTKCGNEECIKKETCERYLQGLQVKEGQHTSYLAHPKEDCVEDNYSLYNMGN